MSNIPRHKYLENQSLAASFNGPAIDCSLTGGRCSFTAEWTAVALTDGDFNLEVSDDPRVEMDKMRGTSTAKWIKRTIPAGSYDGTQITVVGKNITINANAGDLNLNVSDVPHYARLTYVRRGGGAANQAQVCASSGAG